MKIKVSIIGIGSMGQNHLRTLSLIRDVEIIFLYDKDEDLLKKLSKKYNISYTLKLDEAIENVDAVYIVTPTSTHFEVFKKCSPKVKNIFIEKPLASSLHEALEIKKIAITNNNFVQCGFIERFNPSIQSLKGILDKQEIINLDFTRTNKISNRITDVNVVLDLMIHDIDLALFLSGDVKDINAFGFKENNDTALCHVILNHDSGCYSRLLASRMTEKKIRCIEVTTSKCFIEADLLKKNLTIHRQSEIVNSSSQEYQINSIHEEIAVGLQEALLTENQAFIQNCFGAKEANTPDIDSAIKAQNIAEQIINLS